MFRSNQFINLLNFPFDGINHFIGSQFFGHIAWNELSDRIDRKTDLSRHVDEYDGSHRYGIEGAVTVGLSITADKAW